MAQRRQSCNDPRGRGLDIPSDDLSDFGHWLAGFIAGEGSFMIRAHRQSYTFLFRLRLRADDEDILHTAKKWSGGLGVVKPSKGALGSKPQVVWEVQSKQDCVALIAALDHYPLRAKKKNDYRIWREAVLKWALLRRVFEGVAGRYDWTEIKQLKDALESQRTYR